MRMPRCVRIIGILAFGAGCAWAGPSSGGISRDALVVGEPPHWLTLGADYRRIERDVWLRQGGTKQKETLEAFSLDGFVGVHPLTWCSVFVTAGGCRVNETEGAGYGEPRFKGSVGVDATLWSCAVREPPVLAGEASVRVSGEASRYASADVGGPGDGADVWWWEYAAALQLSYEISEEDDVLSRPARRSLRLYAGPEVSIMDGEAKSRWDKATLSECTAAGVLLGADAFLAPFLLVGLSGHVFDRDVVIATALRYRF